MRISLEKKIAHRIFCSFVLEEPLEEIQEETSSTDVFKNEGGESVNAAAIPSEPSINLDLVKELTAFGFPENIAVLGARHCSEIGDAIVWCSELKSHPELLE